MPRYNYEVNMSKQKRFIRLFKRLLTLMLVVIIVILGFVIYDAVKEQYKEDNSLSKSETTTIQPSTVTFSTDYYKFTVPKTWKFIEKESTKSTYVYRSYRGALIEEELDVYINSSDSVDTSAIRVLPVTFDETTRLLVPDDVSDHCNKFANTKIARQPVRVSLLNTSMMCQIDGTNYLIVAGMKGGNEVLKLNTSDGKIFTIKLFYRYSAIPADSQYFVKLVRTFQIL